MSEIEMRLHSIASAQIEKSTSEQQRLTRIRSAYDDLTIAAFDRVDDRNIAALFDGAYREAFFWHDVASVGLAATILEVMQKRGIATDEHYRELHRTYIGARMFDDARTLAEHHPVPDLEPVPDLRSAELVPGQPTELVVDPAAQVLLRRSVDLQPAQTIVVSHPGCHFSVAAMQYIAADPALSAAFQAATWMAPQHNNLELDTIQQWNRKHPMMQHVIAYRNSEWPMIDSWGTPTFYFIKDGVVRAKVEGWDGVKTKAALLAGFRAVGRL